MNAGARLAIALLWCVHKLPLAWQTALGGGLGALLHVLARSRRRIALRNVELCMPGLDERARRVLVREHFHWLGRSLLDRGLFWFAPRETLERLIEVEGDVGLTDRTPGPVMWVCRTSSASMRRAWPCSCSKDGACGYGCSDHYSWHSYGYPASFAFEARMGQHNPWIQSTSDTVTTLGNSAAHAAKFARLAAAFLVEVGLDGAPPIFADGFESAGTGNWTETFP